jgi:signal transduction histidine kinase
MTSFSVNQTIETAVEIFNDEIVRKNINLDCNLQPDVSFLGWREDILAAIANILENAIYWVQFSKNDKKINIILAEVDNLIEISIWNNGPKIIRDLLDNNSLFDPGISGKIIENRSGTGLGLSIAGESIDRNGGQIKVIDVVDGAKFVIELPRKDKE